MGIKAICLALIAIAGMILLSCKYTSDQDFGRLDKGGIVITSSSNVTSESGKTTTIQIVLESQPTSNVEIQISSDNTQEGTVVPSVITFSIVNWDSAQTVTVTGVDDDIYDGAKTYNITFPGISSDDIDFKDKSLNSIQITNQDNDTRLTALKNVNFTLLSSGGCPTGFSSGVLFIDTEDTNNDDRVCSDYCGDTIKSHPGILLKLCSTQTAGQANLDALKTHKFIVLRNGNKCPDGYSQGTIKIDTEDTSNANSSSGNIGEAYVTEKSVDLSVCESASDPNLDNLAGSFITVLKNDTCPTGTEEGWIKVDTEDDSNADSVSGDVGDSNLSNENTKSIYLRMCSFVR